MPTRSAESRCPSITTADLGSPWSLSAISSRHALCSLFMRAALTGKKIGPHGVVMSMRGLSVVPTLMLVEQLEPGHGSLQRVRSVLTFSVTLMVLFGVAPVVSSVTSLPDVDDKLPPLADHEYEGLPSPLTLARRVTRSPGNTVDGVADAVHETLGQGGSVMLNVEVQVVCPVVTQSLGQSTAGTEAVTVTDEL